MAYTNLPTGVSAAELDAMFGGIVAAADAARTAFISTRVTPDLQPRLAEYLSATAPAPIANGQSLPLQDSFSNVLGTVVMTVVGGAVTKTVQTLTPNIAMVNNGGNVVVHNAAGANQPGSPGVAEVSGGVFNDVKLTV